MPDPFWLLTTLGVTIRPLTLDPAPGNRRSMFSSSWSQTVRLLHNELRHLDARNIALGLGYRDVDLRLDGFPRANAKMASPAVEIAFESKWGPLIYATAEFDDWQDNVRAIALSMEALRAVDRYGVSKRGEQYRGWRQLPTGTHDNTEGLADVNQAREWLRREFDDGATDATIHDLLKRAIRTSHPDRGGDPAVFRKVMRAKELIG
jgi:hypothetical protein